jgi:hypothetical protein
MTGAPTPIRSSDAAGLENAAEEDEPEGEMEGMKIDEGFLGAGPLRTLSYDTEAGNREKGRAEFLILKRSNPGAESAEKTPRFLRSPVSSVAVLGVLCDAD